MKLKRTYKFAFKSSTFLSLIVLILTSVLSYLFFNEINIWFLITATVSFFLLATLCQRPKNQKNRRERKEPSKPPPPRRLVAKVFSQFVAALLGAVSMLVAGGTQLLYAALGRGVLDCEIKRQPGFWLLIFVLLHVMSYLIDVSSA